MQCHHVCEAASRRRKPIVTAVSGWQKFDSTDNSNIPYEL
jgi:hypothetical protein